MIDRIKALLAERARDAAGGRPTPEEKHLAAAALMVEAAHMDEAFDAAERAKIGELVSRRFGLDPAEADALIDAAETAQADSAHLLRFTRVINDTFSAGERVELMEMLWEVAYADGVLHDYEAHLLRRIGGLIYVSDRERGVARRRVLKRLGIDDGQAGA